jgi:hypothetical protein
VTAALGGDDDLGGALTPRERDVIRVAAGPAARRAGDVLDAAAVAGAEFD